MNYQEILIKYLSVCSGTVSDVFFELYGIIDSLEKAEQPLAVRFMCENIFKTDSDSSHKIKKSYYTMAQYKKAVETANKKFEPILEKIIENCIQDSIDEDSFYERVWKVIQENSMLKTKRERAYALFKLANNPLVPYRNVGTGISMENDEFKETIDKFEDKFISDTRYILKIDYAQKTQRASLIADRLLELTTEEERAVYLALVIEEVENKVKEKMKESIDTL